MDDRYYNPFQSMDLRIPARYREDVSRYCQGATQDGRKTGLAEAPFPRMVDMWFLAFCIGAKRGNKEELPLDKTHKFMDGTVFSSDSWRIDALMLIAVGVTGDTEILAEPRRVMNLANQYAAGGLPDVIDLLKDGDAEAIYNVSDNLESIIRKTRQQQAS